MANKARNTSGKFAPKSDTPRKIRSVNLTDEAWQWLADVAAKSGVSRNDYLEAMAEGNMPLIETVSSEPSPIMETAKWDGAEITEQQQDNIFPLIETVSHALTTPEEALAHAAIFGFRPEEALADAHFQISMLESNYDELEDRHEAAKREIAELRSQLEAERADWEELAQQLSDAKSDFKNAQTTIALQRDGIKKIEAGYGFKPTPTESILRSQLSDLQKQLERVHEIIRKTVPAEKDLFSAADLLNQLRAKRKKSKIDLADLEAILEILES